MYAHMHGAWVFELGRNLRPGKHKALLYLDFGVRCGHKKIACFEGALIS